MKIVSLSAENIKKLRAVEIHPDGSLVQITGPNGSGKSSVLDAIYMALAGSRAIPSKPVRAGAEKARITLDLGDIIVTRRFTAAGGTSLIVEAADGARYSSPQKMLDDLLGALTFDPLEFSRMDPGRQLETLRGMVQLDVDIDELDRLNAADYGKRTDVNRQAKQLRTQAEAITFDAAAVPSERLDVSELAAEMERAGEHNADIERRRANREQAAVQIASLRADGQSWRDKAAELRREADRLDDEAAKVDQHADELQAKVDGAGELPAPIDVAAIRARIDQAATLNAAFDARQRKASLAREAVALEEESAKLTAAMETRTNRRAQAIATAAMPVEGLGFGQGEVVYNGLPFAQASSAEQLRVSVAIAMAANPKLRVLRIKDGSLLDEHGLQLVAEMATAGDYQVWVERVDTSGKVGVVMEDGAVRGLQTADEIHAEEDNPIWRGAEANDNAGDGEAVA